MKQIYKNLYQDEETGRYLFADDNDTRQIVEQQSYLLIYLLEVLLKSQVKEIELNNGDSKDEMRS